MAAAILGDSVRSVDLISRLSYLLLMLLASLAIIAGALSARAQTSTPPDTTRTDTLRFVTPPAKDDGVDTVVHYTADEIDFDVINKITVLTGNATITYKDMRLEAGRITVDWNAQLLTAEPRLDTTYTDTTRTEIDTVTHVGRPHFVQGGDDFYGDQIAYNMKSRIGRVISGSTVYQEGHYYGEQFKRIAPDVIIARKGNFTTCDVDPPHYHFAADQLKINVGKRVIARPVFLYFDDVPVLAAPYGIFPQQRGRTSGILVPVFGESSSQGRFLRDIGYYWAPSDYIDLMGSIDYYEQFGILGRSRFRYAKRYTLDGHTDFAFDTQKQGNTHRRNYALDSYHNHQIDRNTRLSLEAHYVSAPSFVQNYGSIEQLLNKQLRSNLTLNKSWDYSPWTSSISASYTQHLESKKWQAVLPSVLLNHKSGQLFPPPKAPRGVRGAVAPRELEPPWYRAFTWSYRVDYRNSYDKPRLPQEEGLYVPPPDSTGRLPTPVTILGTDSFLVVQEDGMSHSGGISATARILKYLNLNPRINAKSGWTRRVLNYEAHGDTLDRQDQFGFYTRTTFDIGTSATTKLYGLARRPFGLSASFRHVLTPSVGFTYRPDFKDSKWDYYRTVTLASGREYTYDRFREASTNIGGTPAGLSELFSFGLDQLYQMKSESKGEEGDEGLEEAEAKRFDLLSWSMNTGVDVKKDSLRWSNLGSSFRTSIPGKLVGPIEGASIDVGLSHSFYRSVGNIRIREFYWEKSPWYAPLELLSSDINLGFAVNPENIGGLFGVRGQFRETEPFDTSQSQVNQDTLTNPLSPVGVPDLPHEAPQRPGGGSRVSQLFEMPLSLRFSIRQHHDYVSGSRTSSLTAQMPFSLSTRWDIQFDYSMDLKRKQVTNAFVTVTRDLHCWEASLQWSPIGWRPGYYLRIGLRSPQLRDVKIERRRGAGIGQLF